ncbi:MAG: hypothetical protein ACRELD_09320 [Longimicrobiales bacterium]
MRITLDPVPLVLGIYAYAGDILSTVAAGREAEDARTLGGRFGRQREGAADREIQKLIRGLQGGVKTADKLLKKTNDVWKISRETDLVNLVVLPRGGEPQPRAYVLLKTDEVRGLLKSIQAAAEAAGEAAETTSELAAAHDGITGRPGDYYTVGFDPF